MNRTNIRVAVVEDNGLARANLRNHLVDMGFSDIHCFTNGRELRARLKNQPIDLLLMDFHLGQNKNGVEVVQELRAEHLITHTTCVIFITSDRLPLIVGQIVDMHPEALVLKPYTLHTLTKTIIGSISLHQYLLPVYELMDDDNYPQALVVLDMLMAKNDAPRRHSALLKLKARILTKLERFQDAADIYRDILAGSDKVLWAKWGLIQNLFLDNQIEQSQQLLHQLTKSQLTNDKACEWLARICVSNNQYSRAEAYMQQIREGELSLSAARLKAYIYQAQERGDEAIHLLERKRESNRSVRERFDEITLDLARCYMFDAEDKTPKEREHHLQIAKALIGSAGRRGADSQLKVKKDYMHAAVAQLEGNTERLNEILARPGMENLQQADVATLFDAINAWQHVGNTERAKQILSLSQQKLNSIEEGNDKTVSGILVMKGEEAIGEQRPLAMEYNNKGLEKYADRRFLQAIEDFHRAYELFPREVAFSLNLLQSLVDANMTKYRDIVTLDFLLELQNRRHNPANQKRLNEIIHKVRQKTEVFKLELNSAENSSSQQS